MRYGGDDDFKIVGSEIGGEKYPSLVTLTDLQSVEQIFDELPSGVSTSKYSEMLCQTISEKYEEELKLKHNARIESTSNYLGDPMRLLKDSVFSINLLGTSTCSIVQLDEKEGTVYTTNIGDCGYIWLRKTAIDYMIEYGSKRQEVGFDLPSTVGSEGENPEDADVRMHKAIENDVFVIASNGVWDNLYVPQIIDVMRPFVRTADKLDDPQLVAELIAEEAAKNSRATGFLSPFARYAHQYNYEYMGGRIDDITVIVAQIEKASQERPI